MRMHIDIPAYRIYIVLGEKENYFIAKPKIRGMHQYDSRKSWEEHEWFKNWLAKDIVDELPLQRWNTNETNNDQKELF